MIKTMNHKGFKGSIEYDDETYHGQVLDIHDLIMYEGSDIKELTKYFQEAVDDYILYCEEKEEKLEKKQ